MKTVDYIRQELPRLKNNLKRISEIDRNDKHCSNEAAGLVRINQQINEWENLLQRLDTIP